MLVQVDDLEAAADILTNFSTYWANTKDNRQAQRALIQTIVARVWIRGDQIAAISLRPNYHVTFGLENENSTGFAVEVSDGENILHIRERRGSNPRSPP